MLKLIDEPSLRGKTFIFKDRIEAGMLIAEKCRNIEVGKAEEAYVLAIPAGGVPVGFTVAKCLKLPFYVFVVRKIQVPWNTEAGFGALSWDGTLLLNEALIRDLGLTRKDVEISIDKTKKIVEDRARMFKGEKRFPNLKNKTALLIDDGLASGFTMLTAVKATRKYKPKKVIVATPTASSSAIERLMPETDTIVCLNVRGGPIFAVADAYEKWYDLTDEEVTSYLHKNM